MAKINYAKLYTKRKDGRYVGTYIDGDGKRKYVYDKDPEQLWHKLNDPKPETPLLFSEVAELWWESIQHTVKEGTLSCYEAHYNRAVDLYGGRVFDEIAAADISNHIQRMKIQGYAASTIKKQRTVYKLIFRHGIITPEIKTTLNYNPVVNVPLPAGLPRPKKREAPEDEIVKKIKKWATTAYFGEFPFFLICTGMRRGEALAIRWCDIDRKKKEIVCNKSVSLRGSVPRVDTTKTESGERQIPILPVLEPFLVKPKGAKETDYIFYGSDPAKPIPKSTYDRRWLHYCKDLGFVTDTPEERISKQGKRYTVHKYKPTLTAHVMRHGYATILFEAGVDVYTAKKLLGHADIETTLAIYTHLRNKKKESSIEKLKAYAETAI